MRAQAEAAPYWGFFGAVRLRGKFEVSWILLLLLLDWGRSRTKSPVLLLRKKDRIARCWSAMRDTPAVLESKQRIISCIVVTHTRCEPALAGGCRNIIQVAVRGYSRPAASRFFVLDAQAHFVLSSRSYHVNVAQS